MSDIYVYVCIYPYSTSLLVYSIVISDRHLINITERVTVQLFEHRHWAFFLMTITMIMPTSE